jgi:GcrA cell cycle regulator
MSNISKEWSEDRIASLKQRWNDGFSASRIASELGTTRNAVLGKIHRLGLSNRVKVESEETKQLRKQRRQHQRARENIQKAKLRIASVPDHQENDISEIRIVATSLRIPMRDLDRFSQYERNQCRYIASEPPGPDYLACGNPTKPGESYCGACRKIVFREAFVVTEEDRLRRRMNFIKISGQKPMERDEEAA